MNDAHNNAYWTERLGELTERIAQASRVLWGADTPQPVAPGKQAELARLSRVLWWRWAISPTARLVLVRYQELLDLGGLWRASLCEVDPDTRRLVPFRSAEPATDGAQALDNLVQELLLLGATMEQGHEPTATPNQLRAMLAVVDGGWWREAPEAGDERGEPGPGGNGA